jgi:hypothetical protein
MALEKKSAGQPATFETPARMRILNLPDALLKRAAPG